MTTKRSKVQRMRHYAFAGRKHELSLFQSLLPMDRTLGYDVLVIYGIGGIGKSELLSQFHISASAAHVPMARLDAQNQSSILDFLLMIRDQLEENVTFHKFEQGLKRHRELEARLLGHDDIPKEMLQKISRGTHIALRFIPGASLVADIVDQQQIEGTVNKIYRFLGRKDADFWVKPEDELTKMLVQDLNSFCDERRLVIAIDAYELIDTFDTWVREKLFADLAEGAILILATRRRLEDKGWQEFEAISHQIELRPLSELDAREFLRNRGLTDVATINAMADYADGHPLTLSLLAQVASQIDLQTLDRSPERREVVRALLDRITQNVATELQSGIEMCAILRVINEDSLGYMLESSNVRRVFDQLRTSDFMRTHDYGISLHETVWSALNEDIRWRRPEHYQALNMRAAEYYKRAIDQAASADQDRLPLEYLFHIYRTDADQGLALFFLSANHFINGRLVNRLRTLLKDVSRYIRPHESYWLWYQYFTGWLAELDARYDDARQCFIEIAEHKQSDDRLRGYVYCDLGRMYTRWELLGQQASVEAALTYLTRSLELLPHNDHKRFRVLSGFYRIRVFQGDWQEGLSILADQLEMCNQNEDAYGAVHTYSSFKLIYGITGHFQKMLEAVDKGFELSRTLTDARYLQSRLLGYDSWMFLWVGRYAVTEEAVNEAIDMTFDDVERRLGLSKDLGLVLGLQGKYAQAEQIFLETRDHLARLGDKFLGITASLLGYWGMVLVKQSNLEKAEQCLLESIAIKQQLRDEGGISEVICTLGELFEIRAQRMVGASRADALRIAEAYYRSALGYNWCGRRYFEAVALTGLARIKLLQDDLVGLAACIDDALTITSELHFLDQYATVKLLQGHRLLVMAGDNLASPELPEALEAYQEAITSALRHNRFTLDELVAGQGVRMTAQVGLVSFCCSSGDAGTWILEQLLAWWDRPTSTTTLRSTNPLAGFTAPMTMHDAERIARRRESGEGSHQTLISRMLKL